MKNALKRFWNWHGVDYLIQICLILLFGYGLIYASSANDTLENGGCQVYWDKYNPDVNLSEKTLVNETEAERMKSGLTAKNVEPEKNLSINYGKYGVK